MGKKKQVKSLEYTGGIDYLQQITTKLSQFLMQRIKNEASYSKSQSRHYSPIKCYLKTNFAARRTTQANYIYRQNLNKTANSTCAIMWSYKI